jgi:hypothetical protein
MAKSRRQQILVDQKVQGALMLRAIMYWCFCMLSVLMMLMCWAMYQGPPRPFLALAQDILTNYVPALAASIILLPLVLVDMIRTSNRFCGPVYNLRGVMVRLAQGESVEPVRFRQRDHWADMADAFNKILDRLQRAENAAMTDSTGKQFVANESECDREEEEAVFGGMR